MLAVLQKPKDEIHPQPDIVLSDMLGNTSSLSSSSSSHSSTVAELRN